MQAIKSELILLAPIFIICWGFGYVIYKQMEKQMNKMLQQNRQSESVTALYIQISSEKAVMIPGVNQDGVRPSVVDIPNEDLADGYWNWENTRWALLPDALRFVKEHAPQAAIDSQNRVYGLVRVWTGKKPPFEE